MADIVCLYGVNVSNHAHVLNFSHRRRMKTFQFLFLLNIFTCQYKKRDLSSVVNLQGKDKLHELIGNKVLNAQLKGRKMAFDGKFVLDNSGSP